MASGRVVTTLAPYRNINLGVTGQVVKSTPGEVAGWFLANRNATLSRVVKFYDKATAPTEADTPVLTIPLQPESAANLVADAGIDFLVGISIRATSAIADADTGAPSANDVVVNLFYR